MIHRERPYLAVIFCRTKRRASKLNEALQEAGFKSDELHGDLSQSKREQVMRAFRDAKLELLVATDVAARGIDVEGVTHVFNYDIPQEVDYYIHRIGRTGRAGEKGVAITFAAPRDIDALRNIERGINRKLERQRHEKSGLSAGPMANEGSRRGESASRRQSSDSEDSRRGSRGGQGTGGRGARGQGQARGGQASNGNRSRGSKTGSSRRDSHNGNGRQQSRGEQGGRRGGRNQGGRRGR
ncbi:putative DEAD-box ATP-dependent RNA helicase [compost metagenome]